ncbi:MAG: SH3 domain-containing protein [Paludibacteraceae bacterium]|nr:SH3 domain-containing protein [Paludibacteraceae bacterium]
MITETQIEEWLTIGESLVLPKYRTILNDKANQVAYGDMLRDVYFHADTLDYNELIKRIAMLKKRARSLAAGEAKNKVNTFVVLSEAMFETPTAHLDIVKKLQSENRLPIDTQSPAPPPPTPTQPRPTPPRRPVDVPLYMNPEKSEMFEQLVLSGVNNREQIITKAIQRAKRKTKIRNNILLLLLFLAIGGIGYGIWYWKHDSKPAPQSSPDVTEQEMGRQYICTAKSLKVRNAPTTDSGVIGKLTKGEEVTVLSTGHSGFAKVRYNGHIGYVSEQYITLSHQ